MRRPTTNPKMKMKSVAEIHGATNAWMGTRIRRDHSRRMIVHRPIQLTSFLPRASAWGRCRDPPALKLPRVCALIGQPKPWRRRKRWRRPCSCRQVIAFGAGGAQIGRFETARLAHQLLFRSSPHDAAVGDDGDVVAEPLDLFEIVRGEKNGFSLRVQLLQIAPQ